MGLIFFLWANQYLYRYIHRAPLLSMYIYTHIYTHIYIYTPIFIYTYPYLYRYIHRAPLLSIYMHTHIYTHIYTYRENTTPCGLTHIYIYIYVYIKHHPDPFFYTQSTTPQCTLGLLYDDVDKKTEVLGFRVQGLGCRVQVVW